MPNFRQSIWTYQPVVPGNLAQGTLDYDPTQVGASLAPNDVDVYGGTQLHGQQTSAAGYADMPPTDNTQPFSSHAFTKRGGVGNFYRLSEETEPTLPANAYSWNSSSNVGVGGAPPGEQEWAEHLATKQQLRDKAPLPKRPESAWKRFKNLFFEDPRALERDEHMVPQVGRVLPNDEHVSESDAAVPGQAFMIPDPEQTFDSPNNARFRKAGWNLTPDELQPSPYRVENIRPIVEPGTSAVRFGSLLPERVRAGVADPNQGRPAHMPKWFSYRPFDQAIAQHATGQKGVVRTPLAARPVQTRNEDVSTGYGSFGGNRRVSPAPGMAPIGALPNTDRQVPQPWDSNLYVNAAAQVSNGRRRFTY